MLSERVFRTKLELEFRIKPTPYQKFFELVVENFQAANKQFSFLKIPLVYDRSDQHRSVYNSYNTELANTKIKSVRLENAPNTCSSINTVKFDTSYAHDKLRNLFRGTVRVPVFYLYKIMEMI